MNDMQQELIQDFVMESRDHLSQLEPDLLALEDNLEQVDPELINRIFRSVHSIKGASGFIDLKNINGLSHIMENLLMLLRDNIMKPTSELIDALLIGADRLRVMIDDINESDSYDIAGVVENLVRFLPDEKKKAGNKVTKDSPAEAAPVVDLQIKPEDLDNCKAFGQTIYRLQLDTESGQIGNGCDPEGFIELVTSIGQFLTSSPSHDKWPDIADGEVAHVLMSTVLESDLLAETLKIPQEKISLYETGVVAKKKTVVAGPTTAVKKMSDPTPAKVRENAQSESQNTLRVKVSLLNNLMNLAGELVLGRNQLMQTLADKANEIKGLNAVLQHLNLVTSEMQENIMFTRMQPVGSVFNKFPRVVRDLSRQLGKEIELEIIGSEVELDKSIIESLSDPLTHLIRNTADHGIEDADERESAGKSAIGHVLLRAYHEAGMVNIEIIDDGRGIDQERLKSKALEKGVVSAQELEKMSEREVLNLIFKPGFSTAKEVTAVSGRGVGMDVVKTNIEKLGGSVELESNKGSGTRVNLRLPLTLAIIPSLIVRVEDQKFAIPQVGIEELVRIRAKDIHKAIEQVNGADVLRLRDKLLPLVRLADVLSITRTYIDPDSGDRMLDRRNHIADLRKEEVEEPTDKKGKKKESAFTRRWHRQSAVTVLVLKAGPNRFGLVVDGIADNEEIVVKPLSKYLKGNICYAGATIMGDGSVAMILDPQGMAETAGLRFEELDNASMNLSREYHRDAMREKQSMLLFANGPEEVFAQSLSLITRIEKIRTEDIELIGEREFIKYRGGSLRLVRLHDHLAVSSPEQDPPFLQVIVPKGFTSPVGLVATKVLDVVEVDLEIDTDSISSPGILGSSIIRDRITLILDIYGLFETVDKKLVSHDHKVCHNREIRVLLAEDTPFFRTLEKGYLESVGYMVDVAEDGEKALEMLAGEKYDIVVSDIMMPRLDGFELVKRIRANPKTKDMPVMALTSLADDKSKEHGIAAGFNEYEVKIDKTRLLDKINQLVCKESA